MRIDRDGRRQLPALERAGTVRPVRVDPDGINGPTRGVARGARWCRTSHGFYVPADVDRRVEQRIVEASVVVPPEHAITGWAALKWCGARWFSGTTSLGQERPVMVVIGTCDVVAQPGIAVSGERFNPALLRWVDGVPVTDLRYAVSFEMRYAGSVREAVAIADMACYDDLVSVEEIAAFLTPGQNGWTGVPQARDAIDLARENAWSPTEVSMRMSWTIDTGFREPLCNVSVFDLGGRHLLTPDLIDPVAGVAGEYDGNHHLGRQQRDRDVRREALYRRLGLELVVMTAPDLADRWPFVERLGEAYARAARRPQGQRLWTIDPPQGWIDTTTVAARRALSSGERSRLLRHRAH